MWKVFKVNKRDTSKTKVSFCSALVRFEETLHLVWVLLWQFFEKQGNVQCGIGNILMLISSHIHNAANRAIAKNIRQSYFKKFEALFFRKQQGAIRTDWKVFIFYHLCIMATSLSMFSTTMPSLEKYRKQMKSNYANWNINLIIGFLYFGSLYNSFVLKVH